MLKITVRVLLALALAAFSYDYIKVRADAICAHSTIHAPRPPVPPQ